MQVTALEHVDTLLGRVVPAAFIVSLVLLTLYSLNSLARGEALPVVNRSFPFEPSLFRRWRWALNAKKILDDAWTKVSDPVEISKDFAILTWVVW